MTTVNEAVQLILQHVITMEAETRPLTKSLGFILDEDVYSPLSLPMTPIGGPDGYALRAADVATASPENPAILQIIGTSRAGFPSRRHVLPGTAIRIMTGSVVPEGADCVIRFEDTDEPAGKSGPNLQNPKEVKIFKSLKEGDNIRPQGGSIQRGALLLPKGTLIGPNQISSLAALGLGQIRVVRRPVIAVIPTGDELISFGEELTVGKVYDSNGPAIVSFIQQHGGIAKNLGFARDKEGSLERKLNRALQADAIITSGGVSMGDFDLVRNELQKRGDIIFNRVKMGPGASAVFAMIKRPSTQTGQSENIPVFSLSGPPIGCLVNLETLVRPALLKMRGFTHHEHPVVDALLDENIPTPSAPFSFARWSQLELRDGRYHVDLNQAAPFGDLSSVARANALTIMQTGISCEAGSSIQVLPLAGSRDHLAGK